ncbi:inorganic phosphate transporter, partial [candidate division KSB1 bacterium]|nr:inorganic phosphate transporter [candidate division KSB1 bacterium]
MEFYLFILVILFFAAIADLIVGVANDAVNFLNSAIGSRVAKRRTIMIIASVGVLLGTTFSSGMMEVARKGVFKPEFFTMHEVIIIFLAVMLTDILLLDLYNTFGLPTSTTVSIVFEIFGGAVAAGAIKAYHAGTNYSQIFSYINTAGVITIVAGIGLSVIFAFIFGVIVQFITRLIFTFNYEKVFKRFGGVYSALALTAITYFIVIKGAKGASFLTKEQSKWLVSHLQEIALFSFIIWTLIWQILISFTRINVLKIIVLIGTFALAFSFAANDLVNFIGAPMGGLSAYETAIAATDSPTELLMNSFNEPARTSTFILLIAGVIMVVTLWRSKKAQSVTKTEVTLGRQEEGVERFDSSLLSRGIVRIFISFGELILKITPAGIKRIVQNRIDPQKYQPVPDAEGKKPAFDLLRAAVNLMVSSALISFGTSLKLPLSTTFVTFMVAMSTSLADKSWGRESAVYRVTGVLTVIGGWFFTAFMAFTACFLFTLFIFYLGLPAILILITAGFYFLYRSSRLHKNREAEFERKELAQAKIITIFDQFTTILHDISDFLIKMGGSMNEIIHGLINGKRKKIK